MPRRNRYGTGDPNDPANLTTKGRSRQALEDEENQKEVEKAANKKMVEKIAREFVEKITDFPSGSDASSLNQPIILIHFSNHCRTHDDIIVPAEGAMVAMSIKKGIERTWHAFLRPGKIPLGYRSECLTKARKTHNIPLDQDDLYTPDNKAWNEILWMLFAESAEEASPGKSSLLVLLERIRTLARSVRLLGSTSSILMLGELLEPRDRTPET